MYIFCDNLHKCVSERLPIKQWKLCKTYVSFMSQIQLGWLNLHKCAHKSAVSAASSHHECYSRKRISEDVQQHYSVGEGFLEVVALQNPEQTAADDVWTQITE